MGEQLLSFSTASTDHHADISADLWQTSKTLPKNTPPDHMSTRVSRVSFKSFAIVLCYVPLAPIFYFVMPLGIEREYGASVHWNAMSLCLQYLASVGWRFRFAGVLLLAKLAL